MKSTKHFIFCTLTLALSLSALPRRANAVTKAIPASACQSINEQFTSLNLARGAADLLSYTSWGLDFSCPVLRDNTTNTNGLSDLELRVEKADATSRTCTASAYDGFGNLLKSVNKSVSGTGLHTFDWGTSLNLSSASGATYSIQCSLGRDDRALGYYYDEPAAAAGDDVKILPGNYGKPDSHFSQLARSAEKLTGIGLGQLWVAEFPMVRDYFYTDKGLQSLKVRLRLSQADGDCEAIVADNYSSYLKSITKVVTTTNNVTLSWGTTMSVAATNAYYNVRCTLPANSSIYSVEYSE